MKEYFKKQLESGATDKFFYGVYGTIEGTLQIECHHGPLQTLSLTDLEFDRMVESIPMFNTNNTNRKVILDSSYPDGDGYWKW